MLIGLGAKGTLRLVGTLVHPRAKYLTLMPKAPNSSCILIIVFY